MILLILPLTDLILAPLVYLSALLSNNTNWKIIGALNYLHYNHFDKLKAVVSYLTPDREPGSFYIQKLSE